MTNACTCAGSRSPGPPRPAAHNRYAPAPRPPPGSGPTPGPATRPVSSGGFTATYRRKLWDADSQAVSSRRRWSIVDIRTPAFSCSTMSSWCSLIAGQVTCRSLVSAGCGNLPRTGSTAPPRYSPAPRAVPRLSRGDVLSPRLAVHPQALSHLVLRPARMPVHQDLGNVDHVKRSPCHRPPSPSRTGGRLLLLDRQVHHDTHVIPMGNFLIGMRNEVRVRPENWGTT